MLVEYLARNNNPESEYCLMEVIMFQLIMLLVRNNAQSKSNFHYTFVVFKNFSFSREVHNSDPLSLHQLFAIWSFRSYFTYLFVIGTLFISSVAEMLFNFTFTFVALHSTTPVKLTVAIFFDLQNRLIRQYHGIVSV